METTPDELWSPDSVDPYNLVPDLARMQDTVQDALDGLRVERASFVGSTTERNALAAPTRREGVRWRDSTDGYLYEWISGAWVIVGARIHGRVNRSATPTTFISTGYTNVSANTFWTASVAAGIAAYNNGWVVPLAGRYRISYEMRADAPFLGGVSVNYSGSTPSLYGVSTPVAVQNVASATVSFPLPLSANDTLRLYLLGATSGPAWYASVGFFSVEWIAAD